jgi:hypothetical protein
MLWTFWVNGVGAGCCYWPFAKSWYQFGIIALDSGNSLIFEVTLQSTYVRSFRFDKFFACLGCVFCMQVNLQTGRPVCPDRMSFTLEGHEKHYVKLACGGVEVGWEWHVFHHYQSSRKGKLFGFHFDIGFCRPIPRNVNLKKEKTVCISFTFEGHGDHYVKRVMQWCRGWVRTGRFSSLSRR